jgi:hypothetical protein
MSSTASCPAPSYLWAHLMFSSVVVQIGWTALHLAAAVGQLPMVEMLVDKGGTELLMAKDATVRFCLCIAQSLNLYSKATNFMLRI